MQPREYLRGHVVYKEGSTCIDGLYFISEGDFELTQTYDSD